MPHYLLSAEATFSAAHVLPGIDMCDRLHGHNWRVRVTVRVEETALDAVGMGVDFRAIEQAVTDTVSDFEHRHLNELDAFAEIPPTAERIAKVVSERTQRTFQRIAPQVSIEEVDVWETPRYRVTYRP